MIDLTNQVALVTGGSHADWSRDGAAFGGSRRGCDRQLRDQQFRGERSRRCDLHDGRRAATVKADVSEPEDIASMLDFVGNAFGKLDILVSNAASGGFRSLLAATPRHFEATMKTNVQALMLLTQAALPLMQRDAATNDAARRRKIIAMSSHGSHRALPAYGLIGASKAALESLARHLALSLAIKA